VKNNDVTICGTCVTVIKRAECQLLDVCVVDDDDDDDIVEHRARQGRCLYTMTSGLDIPPHHSSSTHTHAHVHTRVCLSVCLSVAGQRMA